MLTEMEAPEQVYSEPTYDLVQASSGKRLANYLIDMVFCYMIAIFWAILYAAISPLGAEALNDRTNGAVGGLGLRLLSLIMYGLIMGLIEGIFRGKSIGKLITGTKAVNADGTDISFGKALARGFARAVPLEAFSALGNPSYPWHDKWTDTYVIDEKQTRQQNEQLINY